MRDELIKVERLSKKFCIDLKTGLWYGVKDVFNELLGRKSDRASLRKKEFWALQNISFSVRRGECIGLIGRNGAGKTTLLKLLNGLIKPDIGRIEIKGRIGAMIALGTGFNPILTGRENIFVNGTVLGLSKAEISSKLEEIIDFAEIGEFIDTPVQYYSSGMQVRLGFAIASSFDPDVLILDEVLAVGDAAFRVKCFNKMDSLIKNAAVIFVSHNMPQVTRICDHLILLDKGKMIANTTKVGEAISQYHGLVNKPILSTDQGSGKMQIQTVEIRDSTGRPQDKLLYGQEFSIAIKFICLQGMYLEDNLHTLITIDDGEGSNVAQVYEPLSVKGHADSYEVVLCFNKVLFNAGRYSFTVSLLLGPRGELASVRRNIQTIIVENTTTGYAPIILRPSSVEYK